VVYRFQYLTEFNQHKIDERDKKVAKMSFHMFDRLLSMDIVTMPVTPAVEVRKGVKLTPEMEKNEIKMKTKQNIEVSKNYINQIINNR
jgi:hypothetical protein